MQPQYALLIDCIGIQNYIFSSNRLAENVGASFIIEHLLYGEPFLEKTNVPFSKGYIGGGNALLLFDIIEERERFIFNFSRNILTHFPGLKVAFGTCDSFEGDEKNFQRNMKALYESLRKNKGFNSANTNPYKHGVVDDCHLSNEAAETFNDKVGKYISNSSNIKIGYAGASTVYLENNYKAVLDGWAFTTNIEELGQPDQKSYVAVVHIDGNGMGQIFDTLNNLHDTAILSEEVKKLAQTSLTKLFQYIISISKKIESQNGFNIRKGGRQILPIRPIISGGDDFTFVCEGKLGIHLAKKLIDFLTEEKIGNDKKNISACAGVAIVNSKFPFFKAYQLSEELCAKAKATYRKNKKQDNSYLSFFIQRDGVSGELEDMIQMQYGYNEGIYHQVYEITKTSYECLTDQLAQFRLSKLWSKSMMMELRSTLYSNENEQKYFVEKFNAKMENKSKKFLINEENKKLLHDAIELYDFMPEFLND